MGNSVELDGTFRVNTPRVDIIGADKREVGVTHAVAPQTVAPQVERAKGGTPEVTTPKVERRMPGERGIHLKNDPAVTRTLITNRLHMMTTHPGAVPGEELSLDDSAFEALEGITSGNLISSWQIIIMAMNIKKGTGTTLPYTLTGDDVRATGITAENLKTIWEHPSREAPVAHLRPDGTLEITVDGQTMPKPLGQIK